MEKISSPLLFRFDKNAIIGSAAIGLAVAFLLPLIAKNVAVEIPYQNILRIAFPILSVAGLYVAYFLSRFVSFLYQAAKFVLVGVLNTAIDFGVSNFLIALSGIAVGFQVDFFKGIGFSVAVINSYFWNKFWVFEKKEGGGAKEFSQFFVVSIVGLGINVAVAHVVINIIGRAVGLTAGQWANVGFLVATLASLVWNFLGYKLWVFKRK